MQRRSRTQSPTASGSATATATVNPPRAQPLHSLSDLMPAAIRNMTPLASPNVSDEDVPGTAKKQKQKEKARQKEREKEREKEKKKEKDLEKERGKEREREREREKEREKSRERALGGAKKHGINFAPFGPSRKKKDGRPAARLDWKVETPPVMFFGDYDRSTGALVSGQMFLDVDERVEVRSFEATLKLHVHHKKPFAKECNDCMHHREELKRWVFLANPVTLDAGRHTFPFSVHLRGHLPASINTPVTAITYDFDAVAITSARPDSPVRFSDVFNVKRSIVGSDPLHNSVRMFPPTNIKASTFLNRVIHPVGTHTVHLRLDGLANLLQTGGVEIWNLKEMTWRLEETIKSSSPACARHAVIPVPGAGSASDTTTTNADGQRVAPRSETRILGGKSFHEGWKRDYAGADASVEFEFDYGLGFANGGRQGQNRREPRYACDARGRNGGTQVSHALVVEMLLSKEYSSSDKAPFMTSPTSDVRVLRMHHPVVLTECPGLGVSWDEEAPPVYEDVPPSPPCYPEGEVSPFQVVQGDAFPFGYTPNAYPDAGADADAEASAGSETDPETPQPANETRPTGNANPLPTIAMN